ncbi:MAG: hypothetical protein AB7E79_13790 [Rhodospirillaceae bacterium]
MRQFFRQFSVSPLRAALAVLLVALHLGVIAAALAGSWKDTFAALFVPAMDIPFGDFRVVTSAVASAEQGLDPLLANPADHRGRPLNYPRVWLTIGRAFPGETGVVVGGLLLAIAFSGAVGWLVATQKSTAASLAIFSVAVSSSTWLALERGNTDLAIFVLIALGLFIPWRARAVFFGVAAVLKVFPVAAVFAKLARDRSTLSLFMSVAVVIYLAAIVNDLTQIARTTEVEGFLSFGLKSAILLFGGATPPIGPEPIYTAFALGAVVAIAAALLLPLRGRVEVRDEEAALIGGAMLLLCYVAASNWDYRLIFALFMIPYVLRPGPAVERALGWSAVAAIVVSCNFSALMYVMGDMGVVVNAAAKFLLYCMVVFTVTRVILADPVIEGLRAKFRARSHRPLEKGKEP